MGASRDTCPLCDMPFFGKQKFIRCGACEIRFHCVCLQLGEAEQATLTATGESAYNCDACSKASGSNSIDKAHVKSPESLSYEGAVSCASPNEEASPLISVCNQLQAIRRNAQCTIELVEPLVDMVTNLSKEVTNLKNDNLLLKQEIKNLHSFIKASPRPPS
jgi:hypothetical protein